MPVEDYTGTINSNVYSGKEFKVYIGADATVGAKNASSAGVGMYRMDIEGITLPPFSPNQEFEMRSGIGRVAEFGQLFSSSKRTVTEVSLSGRATLQDMPILVENVFNQALTLNGNLQKIATGFSPTPFKHGDAIATATTFEKTLTVAFIAPALDIAGSPALSNSYTLKGCCVTSLNYSADLTSASGRYNYSVTLQSQYIPEQGAVDVSNAQELTTVGLGDTNIFMSDQGTKNMNVMGIGTIGKNINPLFSNISLTIEAPSIFLGAQGTNAEPEVVARSVPEMNITVGGSIKYDHETQHLVEAFRDPLQTSFVQMYLNNRAITPSLDDLTAVAIPASGSQLFGFIIPKAKLTSCEVSSDDVASVNFEMKVVDSGEDNIIHIATGATA